MAVTVFPADAVSGAPSYTGRTVRQALGALLGGKSSARPLGGRSGVTPGTPSTTVAATSSVWTVTPHGGVLDLEASAAAGAYLYSVDANVTGSVTAAHATLPRIDIVYVQLSDPAEGDGTATPGVAVAYLAGTANASPVAPATPARSMVLASMLVPASGGGSPSVSWLAPYTVAAGGITVARTSTEYPANPTEGQYVDDAALDSLFRYSGAAWVPIKYGVWASYTPGWTGASGSPSLGNGTLTGRYMQVGKLVVAQWSLLAGSTTTFGAGAWAFTLPLAASASQAGSAVGTLFAENSGVYYTHGAVTLGGGSSSASPYLPATTSASNLVPVVYGTPWNFKTGDHFHFTLQYETA